MNLDDCTVYSFANRDGSFDFIRVTNELHDLLELHNLEDNFVEAYQERNLPGTIQLLIELGLSKTSVVKNVQLFPNCPRHIAKKMIAELNIASTGEPENDENILYN